MRSGPRQAIMAWRGPSARSRCRQKVAQDQHPEAADADEGAAAKWHEQRGHEQQAAAAEEALRHLQAGYQQAATPVLADLTRRAPRAATVRRFEQDVRATLPDHADRILADPAWTALTTTLAHAETAGHSSRRLLTEVGTQRELDSAEHPAEVLNWRITV
ncbi:hypothetical protein Scinn_04100 [Streptomyces virginiae]|uniref:Uncharacterized protein n=1 Tax=Streptomyces virginiae TaxID=1961 RepID=A0ABQ3NDY7_STRVG|nr:hypothetical protein Scinn_04100 [Streptomyces virginiae]